MKQVTNSLAQATASEQLTQTQDMVNHIMSTGRTGMVIDRENGLPTLICVGRDKYDKPIWTTEFDHMTRERQLSDYRKLGVTPKEVEALLQSPLAVQALIDYWHGQAAAAEAYQDHSSYEDRRISQLTQYRDRLIKELDDGLDEVMSLNNDVV